MNCKTKKKNIMKFDFNPELSALLKRKNGCSLSKYISEAMDKVLNAPSGIEQMVALKEFQHQICRQPGFSQVSELTSMEILAKMYLSIPSKFALKKNFCSLFKTLFEANSDLVIHSLQLALRQHMEFPWWREADGTVNCGVYIVLTLLDSLPFGNIVLCDDLISVFDHLCHHFSSLVKLLRINSCLARRTALHSDCQTTLKTLTLLLQAFELEFRLRLENSISMMNARIEYLSDFIIDLLKSEFTPINCGINAGVALATILNYHDDFNVLTYCHMDGNKRSFHDMPMLEDYPLISQVLLWNGFLATLSHSELSFQINDSVFCLAILKALFEISERTKNSDVIALCSRTILQWTNRMKELVSVTESDYTIDLGLSDGGATLSSLMRYVLTNQEHFIDGLKHTTAEIFENMIKLHLQCSDVDPKDSEYLPSICCKLLEMPSHRRGKYSLLSRLAKYLNVVTIINLKESICEDLYQSLNEACLVCHVSEFLEILYKKSAVEMDCITFEDMWLKPLTRYLRCGSKEQRIAILQYVLPVLLKSKPNVAQFLISDLSSDCSLETGSCFAALLVCVKLSQKYGIKELGDGKMELQNIIPQGNFEKALCHMEDQVRLSAFSAICETQKSTQAITPSEFKLIKFALQWNICCQCPAFRQQFVVLMKKFFCRMKESYYTFSRKPKDYDHYRNLGTEYKSFLTWLEDFLISCLHPEANFPRRVTALHLLSSMHVLFASSSVTGNIETGTDHLQLLPLSEPSLFTLLESLKDTYENNKELVLNLLTENYSDSPVFRDECFLRHLFEDALKLLSSTKPPDSVTASYLFAFLVKFEYTVTLSDEFLKEEPDLSMVNAQRPQCSVLSLMCVLQKVLFSQFTVAKESLLRAAADGPLYGTLMSIRRLLTGLDFNVMINDVRQQWQIQLHDLVKLCLNVAAVVQSVVCNASPEGHLPMDSDEDSIEQLQKAVQNALGHRFQNATVDEKDASNAESDASCLDLAKTHAVTSQMLLLCSWRTHKEVSLLFGDLAEKIPNDYDSASILTPDELLYIGQYFIDQLSLVKHRGAFEQAYIGFCKLCHRLWRSPIQLLQELPIKWLHLVFDVIAERTDTMTFCSSRRSAGLPYLMQALLVSEPLLNVTPSYKWTMNTLLTMAIKSSRNIESQIHSLNILRMLYRDSSLGENAMPFVSGGLKASILGFKSFNWAVRNSSTLLFSALMTRIFGVNRSKEEPQRKNCLTGRIFFSRFPDLYEFLLHELELSVKKLKSNSEGSSISLEPSLYPVLLVLGRLYPSPLEGSDSSMKLTNFIPLLMQCSSSPIWKTRVLASRALFPLLCIQDFANTLENLLHSVSIAFHQPSHNKVHGLLLQVLHIMKELHRGSFPNTSDIGPDIWKGIKNCVFLGLNCNPCYVTRATFMEILSYCIILWPPSDLSLFPQLLSPVLEECGNPSLALGKELYLVNGVCVFFSCLLTASTQQISWLLESLRNSSLSRDNDIPIILTALLSSPFHEVHLIALKFMLSTLDVGSDTSMTEDRVLQVVISNSSTENRSCIKKHIYSIEEHIVKCLMTKEKHPDCLSKIYLILCHLPNNMCAMNPLTSGPKWWSEKKYLEELLRQKNREDVSNSFFLWTSHVALKLYESFNGNEDIMCKVEKVSFLKEWCSRVEACAHPDQGLETRQTALHVLNRIKSSLLVDQLAVLGSDVIPLWNGLLMLLTDDEPDIKDMSSKLIRDLEALQEKGNITTSPHVPLLALEHFMILFIHQFGNSYPYNCMITLLNIILRSSSDEETFQTDEQPFDKGEMNVFAEDFTLMQLTAKHLSHFLSTQQALTSLKINTKDVPFAKSTSTETLSPEEFISLCVAEMDRVFSTFHYRPFFHRKFNDSLLRISQMAYVVSSFSLRVSISQEPRDIIEQLLRKIGEINSRNYFLSHIQALLEKCLD